MKRNISFITLHNSNNLYCISKRFFGKELTNGNNISLISQKLSFNPKSHKLDIKRPLSRKVSISISGNFPKNSLPIICEMVESEPHLMAYISQENKENANLNKANCPSLNSSFTKQNKLLNPQDAPEYSLDIFMHLKQTENLNIPPYGNLLVNQNKIKEKTRAILLDWMTYIHFKFNLLPETFFLSVNILDSYTYKHEIDISNYQLISIASILISCKYEEIYTPEINDFIRATHNIFSKERIIQTESLILSDLKFDILFTSAYKFLTYYYMVSKESNLKVLHLAHFILEMTTMSLNIMKYPQSVRACSALYMAKKIFKAKGSDEQSHDFKFITGYSEQDIKSCIKETVLFIQDILVKGPSSFQEKFSTKKYNYVGRTFSYKKRKSKLISYCI